jgi:hypothetical protein
MNHIMGTNIHRNCLNSEEKSLTGNDRSREEGGMMNEVVDHRLNVALRRKTPQGVRQGGKVPHVT